MFGCGLWLSNESARLLLRRFQEVEGAWLLGGLADKVKCVFEGSLLYIYGGLIFFLENAEAVAAHSEEVAVFQLADHDPGDGFEVPAALSALSVGELPPGFESFLHI